MVLISVVFHPLLMATYCCTALYFVAPDIFSPIAYGSIPYFILVIFITTCLVPGLIIGFFKLTKRVSNLDISQREQRILPFFTTALFYGVTTYLFQQKIGLSKTLLVIMIAVTALLFLILLISFWMKISVHASGIWGIMSILSGLSILHKIENPTFLLFAGFICAGITVSSRLYLSAHTPKESWSGAVLGFTFCLASVYFFA